MKRNFIYAMGLSLILISCSISGNNVESSQIIGKWEWLRSSGGFGGEVITPDSVGASPYEITFTAAHTFSYRQPDSLLYSGIYGLKKHDEYTVVTYKTGTDNFFPDQRIEFKTNDTLILSDECADCYISTYSRIR